MTRTELRVGVPLWLVVALGVLAGATAFAVMEAWTSTTSVKVEVDKPKERRVAWHRGGDEIIVAKASDGKVHEVVMGFRADGVMVWKMGRVVEQKKAVAAAAGPEKATGGFSGVVEMEGGKVREVGKEGG